MNKINPAEIVTCTSEVAFCTVDFVQRTSGLMANTGNS